MKITNNLNNTILLFNQPISLFLWEDDELIYTLSIKPISFKDWQFNNNIKIFMHIATMDTEEIGKNFYMFDKITNNFNFFYYGLKFYKKQLLEYIKIFVESFKIIGINLSIIDDEFFIDGKIALTYQIYEEIMNCVRISSCMKPNTIQIKDKRYLEFEKKINKIKKNNQVKDVDQDFEKSFMILLYDFNFKPNEILEMNLYQIKTILSYSGSIMNYKISLIASGNGLNKKKKISHYTDKRSK